MSEHALCGNCGRAQTDPIHLSNRVLDADCSFTFACSRCQGPTVRRLAGISCSVEERPMYGVITSEVASLMET